MAELQEFEVRLSNGLKGTVLRSSRFLDKREFNTVKLSDGTEFTVPSATLEPQQDGSFYLRHEQNRAAEQPRGVSRGSDSSPAPEDEANIGAALFKEEIDVQRVPVNRILDAPAEIRIEDGVTIIPVMEERLKVERQLILREEIRVVKKRTTVRDSRVISLGQDRGDLSSQSEPQP